MALLGLMSFDASQNFDQVFYGSFQGYVGGGGFKIGVAGSGDPFPTGMGGRTGVNALISVYNSSGQGWASQIYATGEPSVVGFAFYVIALQDGDIMAIANDISIGNTANMWGVALTSLGGLAVHFYGAGSTAHPIVQVTPNLSFRPSSWNYVEAKNVGGLVSVRINGGPIYSATGDCSNSGSGGACVLRLGGVRSIMIDDVYVLDATDASTVSEFGAQPTGQVGALKNNDFLGDTKVLCYFPMADGHYTDWTPKTGTSQYAMVNSYAASDAAYGTTYDSAIPTEEIPKPIDTFSFPPVDTSGGILGVQLVQCSAKDNAGTRIVTNFFRSAEGTDVPMNSNSVVNTYETFSTCVDLDLVTGTQWTAERLDASEWGVEVTA